MACPICTRPTEPDYRPFCSRRCADADLGRWLTGGYAIPTRDDDDGSGSAWPKPARTDTDDDDEALPKGTSRH